MLNNNHKLKVYEDSVLDRQIEEICFSLRNISTDKITLESPNGTKYIVTVSNAGALVVTAA